MKLIGGSDYYDKGMMYGIDDTVVLIRNNKTLEDWHHFPPMIPLPKSRDWRNQFSYVFVIIGDKLYSGIRYDAPGFLEKDEVAWCYDSYKKLLEKKGKEEPKYLGYYMGAKHISPSEYFGVKDAPKAVVGYMVANGYAILLGYFPDTQLVWTANPDNLKSFEFYKAVDAFTLYQTLDMWVSGVLTGSGAKTVEIKDDKIKIQKHGFDLKTSFRKGKKQ